MWTPIESEGPYNTETQIREFWAKIKHLEYYRLVRIEVLE